MRRGSCSGARADHPDQPGRFGLDAAGLVRGRGAGRPGAARRPAANGGDVHDRARSRVLNAGSSSIKFSLFAQPAATSRSVLRGQVESIHTAPRFVAQERQPAQTISEQAWDEGTPARPRRCARAHRGLRAAIGWRPRSSRRRASRRARRARVSRSPCASTARCWPSSSSSSRSRRCTSRTTWRRSGSCSSAGPSCRRSPASTPRSTARSRSWRRCSRCPRSCPTTACGATASTACRTSTSRRCCRSSTPRRERSHRGRCTWATAPACARCRPAAASPPPWASPRVDGLPMGTRCGAIDPGVLLYLMDQRGMDARAIEKLIYNQSGLLGVSGVSSDMRTLLASDERAPARGGPVRLSHRPRARLARRGAGRPRRARLHRRHRRERAEIRERVCRDAGWLGVELDEQANRNGGPRISLPTGSVRGLGRPDERRTDDRPAHAARAASLAPDSTQQEANTPWTPSGHCSKRSCSSPCS